MRKHYFITGANGCIGAWIVQILIRRGDAVTVFDVSNSISRLHNIMTDDEVSQESKLSITICLKTNTI